ncbi:MAG: DNA alkylation repair protein [Lentisphaeraceae bacterium]|nr:DNA alkylation repair protein [Lentisphaeraceae bacterium]
MAQQTLLKEGLGADAIGRIANGLSKKITEFPANAFIDDCLHGLNKLELKARVHHIIEVLHKYLPDDFTKAADILISLKKHWDYGDKNDSYAIFAAWPIIDYIGVHGLAHPDKSLQAMHSLTSLFSAEFAIRPFIRDHFDITYLYLKKWCLDQDEHVRRLVSEGIRPRLPWGMRLNQFCQEPAPILPLLEKLKDDKSEYVRRSVANNLNDISKDHPQLVIATCSSWYKKANKNRQWIIRHATRTLVKAGHPQVFGLLGYTDSPLLKINNFSLDKAEIKLNDCIQINAFIQSTADSEQNFVVDYAIHHVKNNGKLTAKVFKLKNIKLAGGEAADVSKKHAMKYISTRKYYPGTHFIELLINGQTFGKCQFEFKI